ncbi:MAG: hypothetical protein JL50_19230 [Peptococcaceae bacterium BICA1-7]|nr:MAG: hypothetical protein JL50_19230 [Peptococcaceae bacterium BICA1-7]HBV98927.1 hypothetical protein [Desulfotomaculum sp.]
MKGITITRPVIIKVRVTGGYKNSLAAELREAVARLDVQIRQLDLQHRRLMEMENKNSPDIAGGLQRIDVERQKNLESKRRLSDRLRELGSLTDGQEVVHGRVESLVDIAVGDDWGRLMSVEVVLEDGKVVEIRQGGMPPGGI